MGTLRQGEWTACAHCKTLSKVSRTPLDWQIMTILVLVIIQLRMLRVERITMELSFSEGPPLIICQLDVTSNILSLCLLAVMNENLSPRP